MKKIALLLPLMALLGSCTTTFAGTVFLVTFKDIVYYVLAAVFIALILAYRAQQHQKRTFWIWFVVNLLLTPLAGFIYLLVGLSRRMK